MAQKPLILAVETSAPMGSVAIALGEQILAESSFSGPMRHSAELFPAISALLERFGRKREEIEHIYISAGPGSFTGLRIAVTMAKTMHLANAVKIVAVDTLDVIAANASDYLYTKGGKAPIEKIATVVDAKRGQFFIAVYRRLCEGSNAEYEIQNTSDRREVISNESPLSVIRCPLLKIIPDSLMTASQFLERFARKEEPIWLLGQGLVYHKDKFRGDGVNFFEEQYWSPRASKVHLLGWKMALANQFADALTLQPTYLHRPDIKVKGRRPKIEN